MIRVYQKSFVLETKNTTYCFSILDTGQLSHDYYGRRLFIESEEELQCLKEKHSFAPGNTIIYDQDHPNYSLEEVCLEVSAYGKGDIREPFVEITYHDGGTTCDFRYHDYVILPAKQALKTLPSSYGDDAQELVIILKDPYYATTLELHYCVFEEYDVIVRSSKLINESHETINVDRLMSNQLDFEETGLYMSQFMGTWANEMNRHDTHVISGKHVGSSHTGSSSSRMNPFVMIYRQGCQEDYGECFGIHLIYSGNHYEVLEASPFQKSRFVCGMNPQTFSYQLLPCEELESPESVMTYSDEGFNMMSHHLHDFINHCIIRGEWKNKERPVLLNSWEACYFDISKRKLLKLAKQAKKVGIELFVVDDGWFGKRDDDTSSLGDWSTNTKKLSGSLASLADDIRALGLDFGIWIEPEMVNVNSELYRKHPDWVLCHLEHAHSEGRNQRILDLCNEEVRQYIIDTMTELLSSANISYVKWDMNRIFSDYYAPSLPVHRQKEVAHRYILGLYEICQALTQAFPHILFEGCASGGNRFDLGMLCYFPQIWASDNSDSYYRVKAQNAYSYGYPLSALTAHVSSCPNHQTLRTTPLETRFNVAAFAVLGYECNLCDYSSRQLEDIQRQIEDYKKWRKVLQFGKFYRGRSEHIYEWTVVSEDQSQSVGMIMQDLVVANQGFHQYVPKGLSKKMKYHFTNRKIHHDILEFGDLINAIAPIHVKQDSLLHHAIAHYVRMPGEKEDYKASGSVLMAGVKLQQAFTATGYNEQTRHFQDFSSRMYFIEACQ